MFSQYSRRNLLRTGCVAIGTIAGCVSDPATQSNSSPIKETSDNAPSLTWHKKTKSPPIGKVQTRQNTVYTADYWGIYAFDAANGDKIWGLGIDKSQPTDTTCYEQTFGLDESTIYTGGCEAFHAIDSDEGLLRWTNSSYTTGFSPSITEKYAYISSDSVIGVSVETGQKEWEVSLESTAVTAPTASSTAIYVGTSNDTIVALSRQNESISWEYQTGDSQLSASTVEDSALFVGSGVPKKEGHLSGLNLETGNQIWKLKTDATIPNKPVVQDQTIFAGDVNGNLYAVNMNMGNVRWQFETASQFTTRPTVADDTVYIGSGNHLHAVNTRTGEERWSIQFESTINESVSFPTVTKDNSYLMVGTGLELFSFSI